MKLAQHQVQEVPGVDLSSCNSFFAQAVVTVTAGTSSLPSSPKTVSIVVAFRGTASVTLLSECLSQTFPFAFQPCPHALFRGEKHAD